MAPKSPELIAQSSVTVKKQLKRVQTEYARKQANIPLLAKMQQIIAGLKKTHLEYQQRIGQLRYAEADIKNVFSSHLTKNELPRVNQFRRRLYGMSDSIYWAFCFYASKVEELTGLMSQPSPDIKALDAIMKEFDQQMQILSFSLQQSPVSEKIFFQNAYDVLQSSYCHLKQYCECANRLVQEESEQLELQTLIEKDQKIYDKASLETKRALEIYESLIKTLRAQIVAQKEQQAEAVIKKPDTPSSTSSIILSSHQFAPTELKSVVEQIVEKYNQSRRANTL